jgi:hypothetical protein
VLHTQAAAAAAAARQVPEALTLAPEDLAAPPPAADPLGTGSAGAQTTLAVSSEPAAPAAAPNLPELDRLAKTGQVRAFLIPGAHGMQAMPCYGSTLLSGAIIACYQKAQTATKLRPRLCGVLQITAVARRRIQILVATLQQRCFMMRAEMRDLFKVKYIVWVGLTHQWQVYPCALLQT